MATVPLILTLLIFISSSNACMKMIPPDDMEGLPSTEPPMYTTEIPVKTTAPTTVTITTAMTTVQTTTEVETTTEMACGCALPSTDLTWDECMAISQPQGELQPVPTTLGTKFVGGECFLDYTCMNVLLTVKPPNCAAQGSQQDHFEYKCENGEWLGDWMDPPPVLDKITCGRVP